VMIATNAIQLGGMHSPAAIGPTPRDLFPPHMHAMPMVAAPNPLPRNVRNTQEAQDGANWAL
jgi:hypothetical protein